MSLIWENKLKLRTNRLGKLIAMKAPDVIIRNECYLVLEAAAGGKWRALWAHFKHIAASRWGWLKWLLEVRWYQLRHRVNEETACDALIHQQESQQ